MKYLRKVNCASLKIKATFEDQANALRLFTKLKDSGYHDSELLDYWVKDADEVKTNDSEFNKIMKKVK
jgi:hypothetical protein